MSNQSPRPMGINRVAVTRAEARRLDRFVMRVGSRRIASERLGVSVPVIEAVVEEGVILQSTRERLLEVLEREEAKL